MENQNPKDIKILSVAPSARGFGFALMDGEQNLLLWGVKQITANKNRVTVAKVEKVIAEYQPDFIVLEDASAKDSQRAPRIRRLARKIALLAKRQRVKVRLLSRTEVKRALLPGTKGTRYEIAKMLAERFSGLSHRLPPKRRPWMPEDFRMDIFNAVALGVAFAAGRTAN